MVDVVDKFFVRRFFSLCLSIRNVVFNISGALVYLLDLFCNSPNHAVRTKAADLFNKMMADKLVGPKVKITLSKFLPMIFLDAMRENPEVSVHMFEGKYILATKILETITI